MNEQRVAVMQQPVEDGGGQHVVAEDSAPSGYIVVQAQRLGASPAVLTRMLGNLAIEAVVGSVPLLGDLFDAAYKANVRNVRLLEQRLTSPHTTRRTSRAWLLAIVATLVVLLGLGLLLTVLAVRALLSLGGELNTPPRCIEARAARHEPAWTWPPPS